MSGSDHSPQNSRPDCKHTLLHPGLKWGKKCQNVQYNDMYIRHSSCAVFVYDKVVQMLQFYTTLTFLLSNLRKLGPKE